MSAYTDAMNTTNLDDKIKEKTFGRMRPEPLNYLGNQNKWKILLISLVLVFTYYWMFTIFLSMMKNVHSKSEFLDEHSKENRNQINTIKQKLSELKEDARNNINKNDPVCYQCLYAINRLHNNYTFSYILENNRIKKLYTDTLFPLQQHLVLTYHMNTIAMASIFQTPYRLFFISTLFHIINLSIEAEVLTVDGPNIYHTLIIGICIFLFSVFLLLKIMVTLLNIVHFPILKDILTTD